MPTSAWPGPISLLTDLPVAAVRIRGADGTATTVDVRPTTPSEEQDVRAEEETRVDFADGRLTIKGPRALAWLTSARRGSVDVTIELPAGSHLQGGVGMGAFA